MRALDEKTGEVLWSVPNHGGLLRRRAGAGFREDVSADLHGGRSLSVRPQRREPLHAVRELRRRGLGADGDGQVAGELQRQLDAVLSRSAVVRDHEAGADSFQGEPVEQLNELEFDGTYIWANQWQTSYVYRIREDDPSQVVRYTLPPELCPGGTPNGIAWDEDENVFFLTGQSCAAHLEGPLPLGAPVNSARRLRPGRTRSATLPAGRQARTRSLHLPLPSRSVDGPATQHERSPAIATWFRRPPEADALPNAFAPSRLKNAAQYATVDAADAGTRRVNLKGELPEGKDRECLFWG